MLYLTMQGLLVFEFPVIYGTGGSAVLPPVIFSFCAMVLLLILILDEIKSQGRKMNITKFIYYSSACLFNFCFALVHIVPFPYSWPSHYTILNDVIKHFHYLTSEFLEIYLAKSALLPFLSSKKCTSILINLHILLVFLIVISSFICYIADPYSNVTWEVKGVLLVLYDILLMLPLPFIIINLCRSVYKIRQRFILNDSFLMRVKMLVILVLAMLTLSFICLIAELYKATTKQIVTSEEEWNDCLNDETVCWKSLIRISATSVLRFSLLDFIFSALFFYLSFSHFRATFISVSNEKSSFDGSFASTPGIKYDVPSNSELVKPLHDKYTK